MYKSAQYIRYNTFGSVLVACKKFPTDYISWVPSLGHQVSKKSSSEYKKRVTKVGGHSRDLSRQNMSQGVTKIFLSAQKLTPGVLV